MRVGGQERGQVLVFILLAVVGLLGFAALSFDGGRVYAERRRAQSAADTAAYAAAYAAARGEDFVSAALAQARRSGFVGAEAAGPAGMDVAVDVYHPPLDGRYAGIARKNEYYQVKIRTKVDQIFSQIIYRSPFYIEVEAVARLAPPVPLSGDHAVVATGAAKCNSIRFEGSQAVTIMGGNVFSNSSAEETDCYAILQSSPAGITLTGGGMATPGQYRAQAGSGPVKADFFENDAPRLSAAGVVIPDCDAEMPLRRYSATSETPVVLEPGYYPDGIRATGGDTGLVLLPGLYCLDGDLEIQGGNLSGQGVALILRQGSFKVGSETTVTLEAAERLNEHGLEWGGLLLYLPETNRGVVDLGGSSGSTYAGTIWAPGPGVVEGEYKCAIGGEAGRLELRSGIMCDSIRFGGQAELVIRYDPDHSFHLPARVTMVD